MKKQSRPDNYFQFRTRMLWRATLRSSKPNYFTQIPWFTGQPMHRVMADVKNLSTIRTMKAATVPVPWPQNQSRKLPKEFLWDGAVRTTKALLQETDTAALVVIKDGQTVYENYWLNGGPHVQWLSMSVAKSFVSALVGIAIADGCIANVNDSISKYVPVQQGSAYDGVPIKTVLQMSSGARWNENYSDPNADVFKVGQAMLGKAGGFDGFVAQMSRENEPNSVCRYNSGETQILGALIRSATGCSLADYMAAKLVEPLGFESPSYWATDLLGTEMAYAGLNMVARDYARLGECFRNDGVWNGKQVIPQQWVRDSVTVDSPLRAPGRIDPNGQEVPLGYGYQWWIPAGDSGEFMAVGVLNQFIYVNPAAGITVVKLSANRMYGTSMTEDANRTGETLAFFRCVADSIFQTIKLL